jgi:hypothetical protein
MEIAIVKNNMIYKEARECADKINANMNNVRGLVLELYERKGWAALGYGTWRECVTAEFKQGQAYLYYQLEAAQIEQNLGKSTLVDSEQIPETHLRPLSKLEPAQQREAWQKAIDIAPEGKVTAAIVNKIVKDIISPPTQKTKEKAGEDSDAVFQLKRWWKKATKKDKKIFKLWIGA